ncbi:unnamed protein product [Haemonchus placei]|uniref:Secreted protein n=1 Tax=Haemonchus placei TaxID=6290 RepID=A0A0N4WED1_HAEPC|nr:unnamed protein product [Haemonchus placei]
MISFLLLAFFIPISYAGKECVWIMGRVQCEHDPTKNLNVEVSFSLSVFQWSLDGLDSVTIIINVNSGSF